jgi:hypothetical protein
MDRMEYLLEGHVKGHEIYGATKYYLSPVDGPLKIIHKPNPHFDASFTNHVKWINRGGKVLSAIAAVEDVTRLASACFQGARNQTLEPIAKELTRISAAWSSALATSIMGAQLANRACTAFPVCKANRYARLYVTAGGAVVGGGAGYHFGDKAVQALYDKMSELVMDFHWWHLLHADKEYVASLAPILFGPDLFASSVLPFASSSTPTTAPSTMLSRHPTATPAPSREAKESTISAIVTRLDLPRDYLRGTDSKPNQIFEEGFTSRGNATDVRTRHQHSNWVPHDSGFLSVTTNPRVAEMFPHDNTRTTWIYEIRSSDPTFQTRNHSEAEWLFERHIRGSDIYGATEIRRHTHLDEYKEPFKVRYLTNPNFDSGFEQHVKRLNRGGKMLTVLSGVQDVIGLASACYQGARAKSLEPIAQELTRIAGAWTAAFLGSAQGATLATNVCNQFPVCRANKYARLYLTAGGAVIGGGVGYHFGEKSVQGLYDKLSQLVLDFQWWHFINDDSGAPYPVPLERILFGPDLFQ